MLRYEEISIKADLVEVLSDAAIIALSIPTDKGMFV